jgi:hypothetical protein
MLTQSGLAPLRASKRYGLGRYFNEFRLAAYLLAVYTFGRTFGAVIKTPQFGEESDAVARAMKSVHVVAHGSDCTWYGFYRGFGVLVSIFLAFSAYAGGRSGGATERERRSLLPMGWALFVSHAAGAVIAIAYFFQSRSRSRSSSPCSSDSGASERQGICARRSWHSAMVKRDVGRFWSCGFRCRADA